MTNTPPEPSKKKEFVQALKDVKSLDDLFNTASKDPRAVVHDGAKGAILQAGYTYQLGQQTTPAEKNAFMQQFPTPQAMPFSEASAYAKTYQSERSQDASNMLFEQGTLESIVKEGKEQTLVALATGKDTAPLLERNVSDDYAVWFQNYVGLQEQKAYFEGLAGKGELTKEEKEAFKKNTKIDLDEGAATVIAQNYLTERSKNGHRYHSDHLQTLYELKKKAVLNGVRDNAPFIAAQKEVLTKLAQQAKEAYDSFQKADKGVHTIAGYVTQGLAPMIAGSTDDHLKARELLYRTVA
ncbi:hypothetical protein FJZ22_02395 [Candidatus Pacearchaeota archaeon]|nr:hypothetical protein [Candidatus Pacearchaeota archaeon]